MNRALKIFFCSLALPVGMLLLFMGVSLLVQGAWGTEFVIKEIMVGFFTAMVGVVLLSMSLAFTFSKQNTSQVKA